MPRGFGPRGFLTEEEKQSTPKISRQLIGRILRYLKPYWLQLITVFAIIILSSILGLLPSLITAKIIDEAIIGKDMALLIKRVIVSVWQLRRTVHRQMPFCIRVIAVSARVKEAGLPAGVTSEVINMASDLREGIRQVPAVLIQVTAAFPFTAGYRMLLCLLGPG